MSSHILNFFVCHRVEGVDYLVADFNLRCGDEQWLRYLPFAVVMLLVFPIGIPLLVLAVLVKFRNHLHEQPVLERFGFIYEGRSLTGVESC